MYMPEDSSSFLEKRNYLPLAVGNMWLFCTTYVAACNSGSIWTVTCIVHHNQKMYMWGFVKTLEIPFQLLKKHYPKISLCPTHSTVLLSEVNWTCHCTCGGVVCVECYDLYAATRSSVQSVCGKVFNKERPLSKLQSTSFIVLAIVQVQVLAVSTSRRVLCSTLQCTLECLKACPIFGMFSPFFS